MPTLPIGSHTMYYEEHGSGHPLLLIPGLGASRLSWYKQVEPLAQRFRVILLDNRDAGGSAHGTGPYSVADMADDAAALITQLQLGSTYVMGWSMGGFIAQELAVRHPALVKKLILVATSPGGSANVSAAPEILALLMRDTNESVEARVRRTAPLIVAPGYYDAHPEDLDRSVAHSLELPITLERYQRQLGAVMTHMGGDMPARHHQIVAPTLVIHGDYDPLVPYPNGQYLAAHIPGARLSTYPNVGHLPPIEATERFNREVVEFLR